LPTLRGEVRERLKAAGLDLPAMAGPSMTVGTVRIGLMGWHALLSSLRDAVGEDRAVASDVDQLRGLVARFETDGFLPLTRGEMDDLEVPRRIMALADLVNAVVDQAVAEGVLNVKRLNPAHNIYGAGRYAAFRAAGCWIGLDHQMWSTRGRSALWIHFSKGKDYWGGSQRIHEPLRAWLNADPPRAYAEAGEIQIPLLLAVGVEKERVVADAVRQLRELDAMFSGLSPLGGEVPAAP